MIAIAVMLDSEVPVEHFVPMNGSPWASNSPRPQKRRYGPIRSKRLVFIGFMSKNEFDRLCRLSDDWGYRRPLGQLFRFCGPSRKRSPSSLQACAGRLGLFSKWTLRSLDNRNWIPPLTR